VPVVRTFTPIVAGAGKMHYRTFVRNNVIGGVVWAVLFTQLGFWLGKRFPWMIDKIEYVAIVIIVFSLVPVGIEYLRHRNRRRSATTDAP
jgi:membrane-associated protein